MLFVWEKKASALQVECCAERERLSTQDYKAVSGGGRAYIYP